ncbi:putative sporulation protein YtxC [Bacillus lacus]|uniref:Putative sporulation protein YtxC n=1 Tax=Metabacillus lacus TaxID=1983721 RepID=A0A7X2IXS7_9BACI|nr:putative sporulation protein YtxC [Metabacillus lacus]MRX71778.1 putative sporulation protein YtxC [Metabacillus lacus]
MLTIYFQTVREAAAYQKLLATHTGEVETCESAEEGARLTLSASENSEHIISAMISFILLYKEPCLLHHIVANKFYFRDFDEQQQILNIVHSLMDGERKDVPGVRDLGPRETVLGAALSEFIREGLSFSLESFLMFRLKNYRNWLFRHVEAAIEEYKLEQEYQNFIDTLRHFLASRVNGCKELHILLKERFFVYDENMLQIQEAELEELIDPALISSIPMYVDTSILAPLVSISPGTLHVYTDSTDHGMVQTIQNIFQERVRVYGEGCFYHSKEGP